VNQRAELSAQIAALDREIGRRSFESFVKLAWSQVEPARLHWNWHMSAMCEHLEAVSRGQIQDLVICVPPGGSKSLLTSTFWDVWEWLAIDNTRRTISATYAQDLSEKNSNLARELIKSPWFQARWPEVQIDPSLEDRQRFWQLKSRGWRFSTSVEGQATGRHADKILGDDLLKAQDADGRKGGVIDAAAIEKANNFWFKTLQTRRVNAATFRRVLIAQRLHHADTPGKAIEAGYVCLKLPMEFNPKSRCIVPVTGFRDPRTEEGELLDPVRFPKAVVDADRSMGARAFEAQMNQEASPPGGVVFKHVLRNRWIPDRLTGQAPTGGRTIVTVDATFKDSVGSDNVAIQVWRAIDRNFLLIHRVNRRMSFGDTVRAILDVHALYPQAAIHIEDKANGPAILDVLKHAANVIAWSPGTASKTSRAEAKAILFEADRVFVPPDSHAPWIEKYGTELEHFPFAAHDDDVDATTMALMILDNAAVSNYADAIRKMLGKA